MVIVQERNNGGLNLPVKVGMEREQILVRFLRTGDPMDERNK